MLLRLHKTFCYPCQTHDATIFLFQLRRGLDTKGRFFCVPFRIKQVQRGTPTSSQPKLVQVNGFLQWRMRATEVKRQLPIDEHPKVIIPEECKPLPAFVYKSVVHFHREKIVVAENLISETFAVEWEKVW